MYLTWGKKKTISKRKGKRSYSATPVPTTTKTTKNATIRLWCILPNSSMRSGMIHGRVMRAASPLMRLGGWINVWEREREGPLWRRRLHLSTCKKQSRFTFPKCSLLSLVDTCIFLEYFTNSNNCSSARETFTNLSTMEEIKGTLHPGINRNLKQKTNLLIPL